MITTFTGPMHSGKSESMTKYYDRIYNKKNTLAFKPKTDTRDLGIIKSKGSNKTIDAICINELEEILPYVNDDITNIFIDEIQFIKGDINVLLKLSIIDDIDIYCAGLNMTSEQEPFGIMPYILAISDKVVNNYSSCNICGRDASYTYYEGSKDSAVLVGDAGYLSLCSRCLRKKLLKSDDKRLELNKFDYTKRG